MAAMKASMRVTAGGTKHLCRRTLPVAALLLALVAAAAAAATPVRGAEQLDAVHHFGGGRQLQTVALLSTWRDVLGGLVQAMVSALTEANIKAAAALLTGGVSDITAAAAAAAAPPAPAAPAPPQVQLVQLPAPKSGIDLTTDTPVDVSAPVTVSTPVKQTNVQWAGRRLL